MGYNIAFLVIVETLSFIFCFKIGFIYYLWIFCTFKIFIIKYLKIHFVSLKFNNELFLISRVIYQWL